MRIVTSCALILLTLFHLISALAVPGPLQNTFSLLSRGEPVKIVVVGNSVTAGGAAGSVENPSFYVTLRTWLEAKFPGARIEFVPRIIYAIGPEVQFFYQDSHVLNKSPDLVLAEFGAANGAWGSEGAMVTEAATEGYVRRVRQLRPRTDMILMMGIFKTMIEDYRAGQTPPSARFLHRVSERYQCLAIDAASELARRVVAGDSWKTYMDDFIHPSPAGYALYSQTLVAALESEWHRFKKTPNDTRSLADHALPDQTLSPAPWSAPRLVPASTAAQVGCEIHQSGLVSYLEINQADIIGRYTAPPGRRVVGVFMRESVPCGNLDVRVPNDEWVRLTQSRTPHFTVKEDPANRLYRNFFASYQKLPPDLTDLEFRLSTDPEISGANRVQIVGFFEVDALP